MEVLRFLHTLHDNHETIGVRNWVLWISGLEYNVLYMYFIGLMQSYKSMSRRRHWLHFRSLMLTPRIKIQTQVLCLEHVLEAYVLYALYRGSIASKNRSRHRLSSKSLDIRQL